MSDTCTARAGAVWIMCALATAAAARPALAASGDGSARLSVLAVTGLGLGLLLAGLGIAVLVGQLRHRPPATRLDELEEALIAYGSGQTSTRLVPSGQRGDKLDRIFAAFNAMADHIAELEQERRERIDNERALLADLAHDINTPITVLRGYAETLIEHGDRLDEAARHSVAAELLGQSLYVQAIVEDLLTLASERTSQLSLTCIPVVLDPLFDALVDSFQPLASERGVTLVGDADGTEVWADPIRLRQMLTNLIRNSLLHAGTAHLIELGARVEPGWVVIWVEDDGAGVAPELVPHLFDRHRRGRGRPGWGLGLSIVRTLAELHGGSVAYREPERGSRFEIRLPVLPMTDRIASASQPLAAPAGADGGDTSPGTWRHVTGGDTINGPDPAG
jgi:signal transduction histidine kinase